MDFSIDLETLGTTPDCFIVNIGVAAFDIKSRWIYDDHFCALIDIKEPQEGRTITSSTVKWWLQQSEEARENLIAGEIYTLEDTLKGLKDWLESTVSLYNKQEPMQVWGNGATFDISILEHAYEYNPPWKYYNINDVRTIVRTAGLINGFDKRNIEFTGTKHSAIDDAKHQAKIVIEAYRSLK